MNGFTNINWKYNGLDNYIIRESILRAIDQFNDVATGKLLDIGCGKMPYKEYIFSNSKIKEYVGLDIEEALNYDNYIKPDVLWDGISMPFEDNTFDVAFGTEVLEHCPNPDIILNEVYRVLKSGGMFFFTVPFIWNLHETPNDFYRYTPFALEMHLESAKFRDISLKATGGWDSSLAQMLGLWVERRHLKKHKKQFLKTVFKPIIKYLHTNDKKMAIQFKNRQMITGLYGFCKK